MGELAEKRNFKLDLFRAIAITLVVFYHFYVHFSVIPLWNDLILNGGQAGVICFFILSGFLICSSFTNLVGKYPTKVALWHYFVNRVLRIIPLFWFVTLILLLSRQEIRLFRQTPIHFTVTDIIGHLFLLNGKLDILNPVVWTLRIECLFYLLFPLGYFLFANRIKRLSSAAIIISCVLLSLLFFLYRMMKVHKGIAEELLAVDIINNMEGFGLGIIGYFFYKKNKDIKVSVAWLLLPVFGILLLVHFHESGVYKTHFYYPVFRSSSNLMYFLFFGLLLLAARPAISLPNLYYNIVKFISRISYSVYLVHFNVYYSIVLPFLRWLYHKDAVPLYIWSAVSVMVTIFLSQVSYQCVEKPFLKFKSSVLAGKRS